MSEFQGRRLRVIVIALLLISGFASLHQFNVSQMSLVPHDAAAQSALAAVPFAEMQQALESQVRAKMRTPEEYAQAAQHWRDRAMRMDAAIVAVRKQHPAVAKAWSRIKPLMATLGAPAPKSFSEVWPDGSITPSESAELYAQEFVAAAAEAHHGTAAFATALGEASAAAAAATQARLERVRFLNAVAMGTGLLLLAVLIFQLRSALAAPNGEAVAQRALEIPQAQTSADGETDAATTAAAADAAPVGEATEVNESAGADVQSAATEPAAAESAHAEIARPTEAQAAPHAMTAAAIAPAVGHVDPIDATQQIMKVAESAFDAATATPASVIAESASALAASIGADLARDIRIVTRGLDHVPAHLIATTREIVLQLVRNAAVHGIEAPVHRTASGKQSCGSITIEVMTDPQAGTWELSVEDDGRGISRDRLRAAAVRKGLMTAEQAEALDGIKLIALLFKPGFTTAEEVTAHAGRGVGMGVVRSMVEELGGRIGVATKPGRFTRFRISLPMSLADEVAA